MADLRVLAVEPYYGGSHRSFLDGYCRASRHRIEVLGMPARKWKWRMRGACLYVLERLPDIGGFDAILASDFLDVAALRGLGRSLLRDTPVVTYFHENQLTYPVSDEDERDYQFGFTNITTCLASDRVVFNSRYHLDSFLGAAAALMGRMPDFVPAGVADVIAARSEVIPVGLDLEEIDAARPAGTTRTGPLTILWNHRWEYDKGPEAFFRVVSALDAEGAEFRLAVVGESFRERPDVFEQARDRLADRIAHWGYLAERGAYCRLLWDCDVVVSTAAHEFFGLAVVEAACAGCLPVLPRRLSYPEIVPEGMHGECLYEGEADLKERLRGWADAPGRVRGRQGLEAFRRFGWGAVAPRLDLAVEDAVRSRGGA